jgi:predicted ribosome quality control (RQC) complex YloA/Tae2 family protein
MHADMYGSASTIIKNPEGKVVPDNTLMQAATATMCRSKAWDSKIVVSAWWVYATQVSKSPPTGLSLPAGSFMIYGKKNFVYPARLEMGYTLLFALDQECVSKHAEERSKRFEF